jgi:hypothetical protein
MRVTEEKILAIIHQDMMDLTELYDKVLTPEGYVIKSQPYASVEQLLAEILNYHPNLIIWHFGWGQKKNTEELITECITKMDQQFENSPPVNLIALTTTIPSGDGQFQLSFEDMAGGWTSVPFDIQSFLRIVRELLQER